MDLSKHAYFEGKIVPLADAKINIATHGFLYGTAVFGGMRAYWNEEKKRLFVFRAWDHYHRLLNSARMMSMHVDYDEESLIQITLDLLVNDRSQVAIKFLLGLARIEFVGPTAPPKVSAHFKLDKRQRSHILGLALRTRRADREHCHHGEELLRNGGSNQA